MIPIWQVYLTRTTGKSTTEKEVVQTMTEKFCIGRIPIMVKSRFCHLSGLSDEKLRSKEDCAFDIGGYFIIKGSEKVGNTYSGHRCHRQFNMVVCASAFI